MADALEATLGVSAQVRQVANVSSNEEAREPAAEAQQEAKKPGYAEVTEKANNTVQFFA